jgi:hypothetical protein
MKKTIVLLSVTILSVLSLYAGEKTYETHGFTVTYLMLERENISLSPYQDQEDTNCTDHTLNGGASEIQ